MFFFARFGLWVGWILSFAVAFAAAIAILQVVERALPYRTKFPFVGDLPPAEQP